MLSSIAGTREKKSVRQGCTKEEVRESLTSGIRLAGEGTEELAADW